ncbi:MAG: fumarylacetoacetate hydrolase family protein [Alphaproteobacteria bacterium]|nr:fumarylacetoacetate hydrolase family protein [Alphaproteobacteria bacterium]
MTFDPAQAADLLEAARRDHRQHSPLPAGVAPRDAEQAAAVQRELARRFGVIAPAGFKIGATAKRMQDYLGLTGPGAGFIAPDDLLDSGAELPFAALFRPGVECELAVRLGADIPPGPCDEARAAAAVEALFAAIELVENRYGDLKELGTPSLIADQLFHRAAVIGVPLADWTTLDPAGLRGRITVNDEGRGEGLGAELMGNPLRGLAWLAGSDVAAAFGGLREGQVVLLGSVTPPVWLDGPAVVEVAFPPLAPVVLRLR